jgi:hypothetical protein
MKRNYLFTAGVLALALAFTFTLTACPNGGGGGGTSWSLGVTAGTAGTVTVKINKTGIENGTKTVTFVKGSGGGANPFAGTTWEDDGDVLTFTDTGWSLTNPDYPEDDIDGTYTYEGNTATLSYEGETIATATISGNTLTVDLEDGDTFTLTKGTGGGGTPVTLNSVTPNGSVTQTTTQLTLTFSAAITGLSEADITLSDAGITKGTLSGSGPTYTLPISGFTAGGSLSVAVAKSDYAISGSPKTVTIYYYAPSIPPGPNPFEGTTWFHQSGGYEFDDSSELSFTASNFTMKYPDEPSKDDWEGTYTVEDGKAMLGSDEYPYAIIEGNTLTVYWSDDEYGYTEFERVTQR